MPSIKKYDFVKILKDYNRKYKKHFEFSPRMSKVTIIHSIEDNKFNVTYADKDNPSHKIPLVDFLYYEVKPCLDTLNLIAFILSKEESSLNLKIVILPPNKIRYAYLCDNYFASGKGNLGKSCMRSKENQRSLNFYVKNNVRIVVVTGNNHKIHARALLWDNVKSTQLKNSFTYLDRVYTKSEHLISLFSDLAEKNNWKTYPSPSPGKAKSGYYIDNLDIVGMCHFPYTDTFRYLFYKDSLVASSISSSITRMVKHTDRNITLTNQGGGGYFPQLDPDRVREALSGNYISKKDAIKVKRYDAYVLKKNIANIGGAYYSVFDDLVIKTAADGYILKENSVTEVFTNSMIDKSKAIKSPKYKRYIHKSNVIYIKDEIYHRSDDNVVRFGDKWYHISQCFINYDRKKRNIALSKQKFHFWIEDEVFVPYPDDFVVRKDNLIPKEHTIIAYDLTYSPVLDNIEYQEGYFTKRTGLIKLITGEFIVDTSDNRKHLKKFNNKYYIKQEFKLSDKSQLTFNFGGMK